MQQLCARILYPSALGRPLRDPIKHIKGFVMEEMASLTFVGALLASCGPTGFQKAWKSIGPAARHYLFAMDATDEAMDKAQARTLEYAKLIEGLVVKGEVRLEHAVSVAWLRIWQPLCLVWPVSCALSLAPAVVASLQLRCDRPCCLGWLVAVCNRPRRTAHKHTCSSCFVPTCHPWPPRVQLDRSMLKPNLHIAVCRSRAQEAQRGPLARENDTWMERGMRAPKASSAQRANNKPDETYLLHTVATERALLENTALHGCTPRTGAAAVESDFGADPNADYQLVNAGQHITSRSRVDKLGVSTKNARGLCEQVMASTLTGGEAKAAFDAVADVLDWTAVLLHHSARVPGCTLRSHASPRTLRAYPSSFVVVKRKHLISLQPGAPAVAHQNGKVVAYLRVFALLLPQRAGSRETAGSDSDSEGEHEAGELLLGQSDTWAGAWAVVEVLPEQSTFHSVGQRVRKARKPGAGVQFEDLFVLRLEQLGTQQIVVRDRDGLDMLHFVPCSGDHCL